MRLTDRRINATIFGGFEVQYEKIIGSGLECPVCGKKFTVKEDTNYIVKGGYTCSWECFLKRERSLVKKAPLPKKK